MAAGGLGERGDIVLQALVHMDVPHLVPVGEERGGVDHGRDRGDGVLAAQAPQEGDLVGGLRIAERYAHQEAVELGLRQREGALVFDRVLGRHHQEGTFEGIGDAVDADLLFLHGFEQGGLGARGGAVDLVGQQDVHEHRAGVELEPPFGLVEHGDAGHVVGQQVGHALQALELAVDAGREGARQHGLAGTGHVLDQHVPLDQERHHHELDG